ncbi:hypothetical protein [Paenibacillus agilis]|nr:hypothetical protein [Paenibacillus agilis]
MERIIFVEYRIDPAKRDIYLKKAAEQLANRQDVLWYEGTDQPNVFVEQWLNSTVEQYEAMKRMRLEEQSEWDELTDCIPGGKSKLHIWEFARVSHVSE